MLNKVMLIGNLGDDPEARYTPGGMAVLTFRLATSETKAKKNGPKETKTEWHNVVAFGKMAEKYKERLKKGKQVYIEGKIQTRSWEDKRGEKRTVVEIAVTAIRLLGNKEAEDVEEEAPPLDSKIEYF